MQTTSEIRSLRSQIKSWRQAGLSIAFVPTMGNLHEGHYSLVDKAKTLADKVVVSIFVNPMQFGANEDLDAYPRTLKADQQGLSERGADYLFTPTVQTIYPNGLESQSYVDVPGVSLGYCGGARPGHFRGVATVVTKLFNLVQPDFACFGEKDFQQLQVIKTMVRDLSMPIEVIGVPTQRDVNGLALSSRNNYLNEAQKQQASTLFTTLQWVKEQIQAGNNDFADLEHQAIARIEQQGLRIDYFNVAERNRLTAATAKDSELVLLVAAYLDKVRLIDNLTLDCS
ncbi:MULTISPECIES: pantoate--beta-alanine ligase [Pseudoalteromonas]|uniref:Pantothenate synthetase n=1 Tax=Pseudoalteromonas ruthenica TaxID=151081 RepID=A0A0F4PT20_9GAMM|nr:MULTISPECIES: pantoate--beta-alanine ligase [Pseudoalteromonas]KJY96696.1 pantoate--beta-alanine ligase [Pseudoalteromonas ruthenica]KJY98567.1 pantoate--beta-alanine ligase [Pseudoalteromonas ruthenica]MCG7566381.1 pantoate--beta-alanine ligase [Pseudoalteromonas sp. CnMc7-15]MCG7569995.1 pantoate--beta-alanine ligase [Pseudoalteromonas sp. CNC9-20]TLX50196.1 pantoate--beta-alanine ligase [Pseudoalteromonas ruthenica]|tara:strand:- start:472 stop:1323 length:852 start_codon:yes stop_codon:yes gene_type:complete